MRGLGSNGAPARDLREGIHGPLSKDLYRDAIASPAWMTLLIIVVNIVVFLIMAVLVRSVTGFSPVQLAVWGGNSGGLDLSGQWWRLLTYQFLHMNLLHVAVNVWVMWIVGRLTERLYGHFALLFVYLIAGVVAGLVSIVWNPYPVSVGASGAIFGVVGALVAFLVHARNEVPSSLLRYLPPILIFAAYNLFAGASQPGVDNAAHVGGLIAGLGMGAIMVRPPEHRDRFPLLRGIAAVALACALALPCLWYIGALDRRLTALDRFAADHRWYLSQEVPNLLLWQKLALQASSGSISSDDLAKQFEQEILPFWKQASPRLQQELARSRADRNPFLPVLANFADLRLKWVQALIVELRDNTPQHTQDVLALAQQTNLAQARLDRTKLRMVAESLPAPLADNALLLAVSERIPGLDWQCVEPRGKRVAATDAVNDGPAQAYAAGCTAQRMFIRGDFTGLDAMLRNYSRNLSDLPDGSGRLDGSWRGLSDLFQYGNMQVEESVRRTAEWRHTVKGSVEPELVEALLFREWAYAARGHGDFSTVSPQAYQLFLLRSEMAATGLHEIAAQATGNPFWYALSLAVARDQSVPIEQQRATFDRGAAQFPDYVPLYRQMLTSLMPRWLGSTDAVDKFIVDVSKKVGHGQIDTATYARFYLMYGDLEGPGFNIYAATNAQPFIMKPGLEKLRQRYPKSDYILNIVARFYCFTGDSYDYETLRPQLANRSSSAAWPDNLSITGCNKSSG